MGSEGYGHYGEPFITTLAPPALRKTLKDAPSRGDNRADMGALAREVVETQVLIYQEGKAESLSVSAAKKVGSLFDQVLEKVAGSVGDDPEEDLKMIESIPEDVVRRAIWKWEKLPYSVFCASRINSMESKSDADIDEWVLKNERALRDSRPESWTQGLVKLSAHADHVFSGSVLTDISRTITRSAILDSYTFLDKKRADSVKIQPSISAFSQKFDQLTDGLLRGLNWTNLCVAGGIVLGTLLAVNDPECAHIPGQWKNSDIDIYVYGLGPVQANQKMKHIFEVFKANLPPGAPSLVVRNSKTITFFSQYPLRRIQVVLKKVESPREVLLNFDLDICSMAWDGSEVWMLPRACRSLQTGYNVFTMNLIHGHYLGERRASQEQRVFKYASKGYGIRILPSYMDSLNEANKLREKMSTKNNKLQELEPTKIAENARAWTDKIATRYLEWNHTNQLSYMEPDRYRYTPTLKIKETDLPVFTHAMFDFRVQNTEEPAQRSCLTGFELLMRHVRLWEKECAGELRIQDDVWASTSYNEVQNDLTYDDAPRYEWDESFTIDGLKKALDHFNKEEFDTFTENGSHEAELPQPIQRTSYARTVDQILQPECDIVTGLFVPPTFTPFANTLVVQALKDNNVEDKEPLQVVENIDQEHAEESLDTCLWTITSLSMWQLLDRRIDEVNEALWSIRRANERIMIVPSDRVRLFKSQAARRAIRNTITDEFKEFARWVGRKPINGASHYPGIGQGFWEEEDMPYWEEEQRLPAESEFEGEED